MDLYGGRPSHMEFQGTETHKHIFLLLVVDSKIVVRDFQQQRVEHTKCYPKPEPLK